jgi:hypothetical protein
MRKAERFEVLIEQNQGATDGVARQEVSAFVFLKGTRASADQHAFLFDGLNPRKFWVVNDGGISMSSDLGTTWRKRSHGILAGRAHVRT